MSRDKYGHYVNNAGVVFKVHTDKNGKDHIDIYDGPVDGPHEALHVNIDFDNGRWNAHYHDKDGNSDDNDDPPYFSLF